MKNHLHISIIMLICSIISHAQVTEYFFTQQNLAYTEMTGGTVLWSGTFDNEVSGEITIPAFTFNGTTYTSLFVSANGFVTFGIAPAATNYTPISNAAIYTGAISAFGRDLNQAGTGSPEVRYQQSGNEFVIQWKDIRRKDIASEIISFQVRLNTSNNYVFIVFGGTITPGSNTSYPQVGIRGASDADYNNRYIINAGGNWINSTTGTINSRTMYFNIATPATVPSPGLTYSWKPLYNPTNFTSVAISLSQIDLSWQKNSLNHNVMIAYNTSSTFGTPVSGTAYPAGNTITGGGTVLFYGDGTSFSHTMLNDSIEYYYKIWSYDAVPDYSTGAITNARTAYPLTYLQNFNGTTLPPEWSTDMSMTANHGPAESKGLNKLLSSTTSTCHAVTPLVGSITTTTNLSFHYRIADYLGYPLNATSQGSGDKIEIQVSMDDGATFTTFHTIDQTNHNVTTEFANKVLSLAAYTGDFIKIRFLCTWSSGDYYVDIDNVLLEDGNNMSYSGSTIEQPNISNLGIGSANNDIIRLQVITQKSANPLYVTSISVSTSGTTPAATDIASAKMFYTTGQIFSTANQFGNAINNPGGGFIITGSQVLAQGNNYFWLAYDIKPNAVAGNVVDGACSGFITSESGIQKVPNTSLPNGNRKIGAFISGIKAIPADYSTIAAAVTALNNGVVGSGGVTFNVSAGHTESNAAPIVLTATGTSSNPVLFHKNGTGNNPLVTRTDAGSVNTTTLGNHGDGVIIIEGGDYITFDSIDVTTQNQGIEYGYYLRKASVTNGCSNVTVKNSTITMTKGTSGFVVGLCAANNSSSANNIGITTQRGRHESITFTGNIIGNVSTGMCFRGSDDFNDYNFTIGSSGFGNTIRNFAGTSANPAYGIYLINNKESEASYNTMNNMTGGGSAFTDDASGIHNASANAVGFAAEYNSINLTSTSSLLYGIYNSGTGELQLNSNTIAISNTASSSATYAFIYNSQGSSTTSNNTDIKENIFAASTFLTTGSSYLIYNNSSQQSPGVTNIQDNSVSGAISRTGASGNIYFYYNNSAATGTENISGNDFSTITLSGTSSMSGIYSHTSASHTQNIYNNTISNITGGSGSINIINLAYANNRSVYGNGIFSISGGGIISGISLGDGSNPGNIYKNEIYDLLSSSNSSTDGLVNGILISSGTAVYIYNNFISDLKTPAADNEDAIRGISITSTLANSTIGVYYNTIYLDAVSSGTSFGTSGIYHTSSSIATTAALDLRNNIIINKSTQNGASYTVSLRRSTSSLNNYLLTSNNNIFYAGTPGIYHLIYTPASCQSIEAYRTLAGPGRDSISFSEDPPFVNVTTAPYNLLIQDGITTYCESGARPVTVPVTVTDDFDGAARPANPDIGADGFSGTAAYVEIPSAFSAICIGQEQINLAWAKNPSDHDVMITFANSNMVGNPINGNSYYVGDLVPSGGTVVYKGPAVSFILSDLNSWSQYYYKAWSVNMDNYYSMGVTANAITDADPVIALPYLQDFGPAWSHTPAAPDQWKVVNAGGTDTLTWKRESSYYFIDPACAEGSGNQDDYLISPPVTLPNFDCRMVWQDKVQDGTQNNTYSVLLSTTGSEPWSFTTNLDTFNCTNVSWTQHEIDLSPYKNQTVFLAFHQYYSNSPTSDFAIDEVLVETYIATGRVTTWNGNASSTWTNPANWSDGVPRTIDTVVIMPGAYYPIISTNVTILELTIEVGADIIIAPGGNLNVTGN